MKCLIVGGLMALAISLGMAARNQCQPHQDANTTSGDWRKGCDFDYQADGSHMRCEVVLVLGWAGENCYRVYPSAPGRLTASAGGNGHAPRGAPTKSPQDLTLGLFVSTAM